MINTKIWVKNNYEKAAEMIIEENCPSDVGLKDDHRLCNKVTDDCKRCWNQATENKGE